ncbi:MAG: TetR family transcriptional regulator [Rhodocyclaceae bacterium]|nr:TetR family transcriptional regulator [Rhodocyclaceae bacterium]
MARTRSQDYDSIKQTILESAARLFAEKGFASTSINEIAAAAGLSKAGIYHYFDTKNEILRDMLVQHLEVVSDVVDTALNSSDPPREKLLAFTRMLVESYTRPASRNENTVLLNEIGSLDPKDREFVIASERRMVRSVERLLLGIQPGLAKHEDYARPLVMLFFGMLNWTDHWYSAGGRMPPAELGALAAEVFLNGLDHMDYAAVRKRGQPPKDPAKS